MNSLLLASPLGLFTLSWLFCVLTWPPGSDAQGDSLCQDHLTSCWLAETFGDTFQPWTTTSLPWESGTTGPMWPSCTSTTSSPMRTQPRSRLATNRSPTQPSCKSTLSSKLVRRGSTCRLFVTFRLPNLLCFQGCLCQLATWTRGASTYWPVPFSAKRSSTYEFRL